MELITQFIFFLMMIVLNIHLAAVLVWNKYKTKVNGDISALMSILITLVCTKFTLNVLFKINFTHS